jgi:hypothetical protein
MFPADDQNILPQAPRPFQSLPDDELCFWGESLHYHQFVGPVEHKKPLSDTHQS